MDMSMRDQNAGAVPEQDYAILPPELVSRVFRPSDSRVVNWHWHPEIELTRVLRGRVSCSAGSKTRILEEGQYAFLNTNVLHMFAPVPGTDEAETASILFRPELIAAPSSPVYPRYIEPIVNCAAMAFFTFDGNAPWRRQAQKMFDEIWQTDPASCFGYELYCLNRLSELWLQMADHMRGVYQGSPISESQYINEQRTRLMLAYIHQHYAEDITVDSIAASASISRSECFRCFRRSISRKPVEYLTEYRIEQARKLLLTSDLPVTQIGEMCGFSSPSYFGKVFKAIAGLSPRAFRSSETAEAQ